jgi:hypothetical protein
MILKKRPNAKLNGLKELISSQNNLKSLTLSAYNGNWSDIMPAITE